MYSSNYNVTATNQKTTDFNRAQMVRAWFADAYPHQFTRDEKRHLRWVAKWAAIGFVVASVARCFVNQL